MTHFSHLLPFLSDGFCIECKSLLQSRLQSLEENHGQIPISKGPTSASHHCDSSQSPAASSSSIIAGNGNQRHSLVPASPSSSPSTVLTLNHSLAKLSLNHEPNAPMTNTDPLLNLSLPEEHSRMLQVRRVKDYHCIERISGKPINVLQGLELHTRVFNQQEQTKIVDFVYDLQRKGQSGKLRDRTYSEPKKWMRGKGRVTLQFGCCYNYAIDKNGNPPGIIRDEQVDPIPSLFKAMIKRMVRWRVLPPTCIPNSCIVNIYEKDDCIPPHIDHHDFVRPFCTVSFLTESKILFGSNLKVVGAGEFSGAAAIPLPIGSVLVLKGNGADIAKHCVPAVREKRISITFRKMDDSKLPFKFVPDPELKDIQPIYSNPASKVSNHQASQVPNLQQQQHPQSSNSPFRFGELEFPPLGAATAIATKRPMPKRN